VKIVYFDYTRPACLVESIVLSHWKNSLWAERSLHSDTLSWFQANQSFLLLLCA